MIAKISMFCMVPATHVISVYDVSNIYKVPVLLLEQRVHYLVLGALKLNKMPASSLPKWKQLADRAENAPQNLK